MKKEKREKISGLVLPVSCRQNNVGIYLGLVWIVYIVYIMFLASIDIDTTSATAILFLNFLALITAGAIIKLDYSVNSFRLKKFIKFTSTELECGTKVIQGFEDILQYEKDQKVTAYLSFENIIFRGCNFCEEKTKRTKTLSKKDIGLILVYKYLNFITFPVYAFNLYALISYSASFSQIKGLEVAMFFFMNVLLVLIAFAMYAFLLRKTYEKFNVYMKKNNLSMFANKEIRFF